MIRLLLIAPLLLTSFLCFAGTSMDLIVNKYQFNQCANQLTTIAEEVIGTKEHRLLPVFATNQANYRLVTITGVINYRDRQSHIVFSASPSGKDSTGCDVSYNESFVFASPCILVREEVFKKWPFKGKLNNNTQVFVNKNDHKKLAYLTNATDSAYCLVSIKKSIYI